MTYRYKHIDLFIVLVVELNYEQEERGDTVSQTCYLYGSEGLFALVIRRDGQDSVRYCHRDHLGSVIGYSGELGHLIQELSYDAWGRRRDPGTWAYLPTLASAGGAAGAMVGAILNGQNFGQILKSTFQGALFGAMSGALNFSIGGVSNMVARLAAHSVADGLMEGVQGGNVLHGAMLGLLSAGSGEGLMALGGSLKTGMKVAIQSVIGGTLSELGGGNFANGAITAAFSFLFNHMYHQRTFEEKSWVFVQVPLDEKAPLKGVYLYAKAYVIMTRLGRDMLLNVIGNTSYAPHGDDGDFISAMSATLLTNGKPIQTKYLELDSSSSYIP